MPERHREWMQRQIETTIPTNVQNNHNIPRDEIVVTYIWRNFYRPEFVDDTIAFEAVMRHALETIKEELKHEQTIGVQGFVRVVQTREHAIDYANWPENAVQVWLFGWDRKKKDD